MGRCLQYCHSYKRERIRNARSKKHEDVWDSLAVPCFGQPVRPINIARLEAHLLSTLEVATKHCRNWAPGILGGLEPYSRLSYVPPNVDSPTNWSTTCCHLTFPCISRLSNFPLCCSRSDWIRVIWRSFEAQEDMSMRMLENWGYWVSWSSESKREWRPESKDALAVRTLIPITRRVIFWADN